MICGIDEAGRGPVIGPMVVAGVWINDADETRLINAGVRDSKKLPKAKREKLAEYIMKNFTHEMIVVKPEDIDVLREEMTMNELEAYIFARLANRHEAATYYIDAASTNEEDFEKMVRKNINHECKIVCEHGADEKYPVVSAASIVAKVERDRQIRGIAKMLETKLNMPMGSGYPSDERTIRFIKAWVKKFNEFPPHIRKSWSTIRDIENEMRQQKLF
ncbi:MAG: ribonuclease HII [Thermoplasmata archaeon]|nr:ribonuclease HII [Thermoplasmata archaeon]